MAFYSYCGPVQIAGRYCTYALTTTVRGLLREVLQAIACHLCELRMGRAAYDIERRRWAALCHSDYLTQSDDARMAGLPVICIKSAAFERRGNRVDSAGDN